MIKCFGSKVSAAHLWRCVLPICGVGMLSGRPVEQSSESENVKMMWSHGECGPFVALMGGSFVALTVVR